MSFFKTNPIQNLMNAQLNSHLKSIGASLFALCLGLGISLIFTSFVGENPLNVLSVLVHGAFGGASQIGYSLFYATPFVLTGLSVAWALQSGLFNVGAEGQMLMGGIAATTIGISFPNLPSFLAIPLAFMAAFVVGGLWGFIAAWIKVNRGSHEVLLTILLNFIAYGISGFFILNLFRNPQTQNPETFEIGKSYRLWSLSEYFGSSPINSMLFVAILLCLVYAVIFKKSIFGFHQRLSGQSPQVALRSGIDVKKQTYYAMFIAGGLAGLASANPIMGEAYKAREAFSGGAGFIGIAVALLGQNSALGVLASAFLFGALAKGSQNLDLDTQFVTRDLAQVIQACIVIVVASRVGLASFWKRK